MPPIPLVHSGLYQMVFTISQVRYCSSVQTFAGWLMTPSCRDLHFVPVQCMGHPKPPCHLLMLLRVTLVHKELTPSGLSFIKLNIVKELLLNLPFKAHTINKNNSRNSSKYEHCSPHKI